MTDEPKPWYASRTIWASLVTIACAVAGVLGVPLSDADATDLTETVLGIGAAVGALVAILGRIAARNRIG
ncbi:MAG: hypothetical protein AB7I79_07230 [Rhizobiaceae bacterium]